jgi:Ca-activated chloride channel family protein
VNDAIRQNARVALSSLVWLGLVSCGVRSEPAPAKMTPVAPPAALATPALDAPFVVEEPPRSRTERRSATDATALRVVYSNVAVSIENDIARTVVTDVYVNDGKSSAPLTYRFPLPGDANVVGFADFRDGERHEAAFTSREAAKKEFDRAKASGEHAALGETDAGASFHLELTPIAAGQSRRVELSYVQTLHSLGSERNYVFPSAQYTQLKQPTLLEILVRAVPASTLLSLETPNQADARNSRPSPKLGLSSLQRFENPLSEDFVVRYSEAAEPLELAARGARVADEADGFVTARFAFNKDPWPEAGAARDVILVLDTSLSMSGPALERGKELATRVIDNLSEKDGLALVSFDASVRSWGNFKHADAVTRDAARREVRELRAQGASNLDAAIDRAAELVKEGAAPVLVLISDGQPTLGDDLEHLTPTATRQDFQKAQTFIALFNYPSRQAALEALFPKVVLRYVPNGVAGQDVARRLAELASAPVIQDIAIEVSGASPGSQHGAVPTALVLGDQLRVMARAPGAVTFKVKGTLHGRPVSLEQALTPAPVADGDGGLPVEWARARIHEFESTYRDTHDESLRQSILELGGKYHVASAFTSLVASDSLSPDRVLPGDPELRVRAPRSAEAVSAILPWGETVTLAWCAEEGLWLGRFLVPRGTSDGLYPVRVLVDFQGVTSLRSTLPFRVDSAAPRFKLRAEREGDSVRFDAEPVRDVFDRDGVNLRLDLVDVKRVVVRFAGAELPLIRVDARRWTALSPPLEHDALTRSEAAQRAELVATDFAGNHSHTTIAIELGRSHR